MNIEDVFNSLISGELSKHGMTVTGTLAESDKVILTPSEVRRVVVDIAQFHSDGCSP